MAPGSLTSSEGSSTPVASAASSQEDLKESRSTDVKTSASVRRGSRKFSAPGLRFTRQLSVGGVGSSSGVHHNQDFYPFPNRKTPRISEAARRLGMYSSF